MFFRCPVAPVLPHSSGGPPPCGPSQIDRRSWRAFASVSRVAVSTAASAISLSGQRRSCRCRRTHGGCGGRALARSVVATECPRHGKRRDRFTAGTEARVRAARARRWWRRWWKPTATAAVASSSDWARSTHRAHRQARRDTSSSQRRGAAQGAGTARCKAAGRGKRVHDWVTRGVAVASVFAWVWSRRGRREWNGIRHWVRCGFGNGLRVRWWVRRRGLPPWGNT